MVQEDFARRAFVWLAGAVSAVVGIQSVLTAEPARATYPGTNGLVAFTSTQDGPRHIFLNGPSGVTDLTGASSSYTETQPKFSPDGREILFTRGGPGLANSEIFVISATGQQRTALTNTPQGNPDATWSPDGTQIAFISTRDHGITQIFVMRTDGTGVHEITHDTTAKRELAWSPRGGQIAFVSVPQGGGDREIDTINVDGSGLRDISNDPAHFDSDPSWSPDGTRIAYSGPLHPKSSVGGDLWTMNADGSNQQPLQHESNGYSDGAYPAWSPDGSTIAFTANNGSGYYHVWSVPSGGGQNTELVANKVGNPLDNEVDWQPQPTGTSPVLTITSAKIDWRRRAATLAFATTAPATDFRCSLTGPRSLPPMPCTTPAAYRHLRPGTYTFTVRASAPGETYRAATRTFAIPKRKGRVR